MEVTALSFGTDPKLFTMVCHIPNLFQIRRITLLLRVRCIPVILTAEGIFSHHITYQSELSCVCFRKKIDEMISEEDLVNGKEKCYFQEKKCLTDIHNRTAIASK